LTSLSLAALPIHVHVLAGRQAEQPVGKGDAGDHAVVELGCLLADGDDDLAVLVSDIFDLQDVAGARTRARRDEEQLAALEIDGRRLVAADPSQVAVELGAAAEELPRLPRNGQWPDARCEVAPGNRATAFLRPQSVDDQRDSERRCGGRSGQ
jgi:hypothetical protein